MRLYGPDTDGSRRRTRLHWRAPLALISAVTLLLGIAVQSPALAATSHDPFGSFESLTYVSGGKVVASGWVIDPDTTASTVIGITANGIRLDTVTANQPRADVATKYPSYGPNHGWTSTLSLQNGTYKVCALTRNVGAGTSGTLGCRTITVNNNPGGHFIEIRQSPGGYRIRGWILDPNTPSAVPAHVFDNGRLLKTIYAGLNTVAIPSKYTAYYGANHAFDAVVKVAAGPHKVCVDAINLDLGAGVTHLECRSITISNNPAGSATIGRVASAPNSVSAAGWAYDPDSAAPINVQVSVSGTLLPYTATANIASGATGARYPDYGNYHAYSKTVTTDAYEHKVCVIGVNVMLGANTTLGCKIIPSTGDTTPAPVPNFQAWPGNTTVDLTWTAPRSPNAAITAYRVTSSPGAAAVTVNGSTFTARFSKLTNGTRYTFSIAAVNSFGTGTSTTQSTSPANIPPQFSPAPVSTSHYPRNWTGNATTDAAILKKMGATDASYNPSGHRYLVLQDVGGQDQGRGGVLLSATSKYFSYAYLVTMMKAYMDGYHSAQKPYAPLVLAIGTNNDVDVSGTAGAQWANSVVDPLAAYAARYPGITVAGANDIEPGFSASVAESKSWVSGYLANTSAKYVFNGSADGCSTSTAGTRCNNGWTMADLQWVGGGASPTRSIALPQVYNSAMSVQWKYISLTGVNARKAKLYFGGPLTEWTACDQAGSCFSISNVNAWSQLWQAISSISQTRQYDMPFGTDLKIN